MKEKLVELIELLSKIEILTDELTTSGATLTYTIGSEQKAVEVKTAKVFSIDVKATINTEL